MKPLHERLADATLLALRAPAAAWPRGLLSAALIPDGWMSLVEAADGRRWFVPAGEDPRPPTGGALTLVRNRPLQIPLPVTTAAAVCGAECTASGDVLLRWSAREDELAALAALLAGQADGELRSGRLAEWLDTRGGRAALRTFIQAHDATTLIDHDQRTAALAALRAGAQEFAFFAGFEFVEVVRLEMRSPALAARRAEEQAETAALAAQASAARIRSAAIESARQELRDAAKLLSEARAAAGEHPLFEVLAGVAPARRAVLLQNLWRLVPRTMETSAILVLTSDRLAWLSPAPPHDVEHTVSLPGDLGPARALLADGERHTVWIGAAQGVWRLALSDGRPLACYPLPHPPTGPSRVNALLRTDENLYFSHGELGLWRLAWRTPGEQSGGAAGDSSNHAGQVARCGGTAPARALSPLPSSPGSFILARPTTIELRSAAGENVETIAAPPAAGRIHALAASSGAIFAATEQGGVLRADIAKPQSARVRDHDHAAMTAANARSAERPLQKAAWVTVAKPGVPVESLMLRQLADVDELIFPAGAQGIRAIYPTQHSSSGGAIETVLLAPPWPVRRVFAGADVLIALSAGRDRVALLESKAETSQPAERLLAQELGQRIEDIAPVDQPRAAGRM